MSLIGTCAVMAALGFSLNTLTLFGLVLAIGIVVDDAIVVVENVERNIALGLTPREAAHRTMDEVGTAIIAISLVLTAVFVPTAFIPGISGQFYRQFALTIAVSTAHLRLQLADLVAGACRHPAEAARHPRSGNALVRGGRWLAGRFNRGFDRASGGYAASVGSLVKRRIIMLAIYAGLLAGTVYLANAVPRGFIPQLDQGYAIVVIQLPDGASLSRTDAVVQARLRRSSRIRRASSMPWPLPGFPAPPSPTPRTPAAIFARFAPFEERLRHGQSGIWLIGQLFARLQSIEEAFIIAIPPPPVRGIGSAGGFKMQLQERVGAEHAAACSRRRER